MNDPLWLVGVDFSGAVDQWSTGRTKSNVWLAFAESEGASLRIDRLVRVQALEGADAPYLRLSRLFARDGLFIAVDAPFSVPGSACETAELAWRTVLSLPHDGRAFPKAARLVEAFGRHLGPRGAKIYRETEQAWRGQLNVRSTLWCGPRGGAPFAAAMMGLLARHTGPVWAVREGGDGACLIEAFPAAQLRHWALPHQGYNGAGADASEARRRILDGLIHEHALKGSASIIAECEASADALDAVICAYAAAAVGRGRVVQPPGDRASVEGWISIHA